MSGIWYVDLEIAGIMIGEEYELEEALKILAKQIEPLNGGSRWLVKDFVRYQYGEFSKKSRVHIGVKKCAAAQGLESPWCE